MTEWILSLPTWMMTRTMGLAAYYFLFLGVSSGILYSMPNWKSALKKRIIFCHNFFNWMGLVSGLLHSLILIIDSYMTFDWLELLVPFTSKNDPLWNGLGTIAIYGLILVLLTTELRNRINRNLWRSIHLLAYPIFMIALIHGIGVGTDLRLGWVQNMYWITLVIIVLLTLIRSSVRSFGTVEPKDAHRSVKR